MKRVFEGLSMFLQMQPNIILMLGEIYRAKDVEKAANKNTI